MPIETSDNNAQVFASSEDNSVSGFAVGTPLFPSSPHEHERGRRFSLRSRTNPRDRNLSFNMSLCVDKRTLSLWARIRPPFRACSEESFPPVVCFFAPFQLSTTPLHFFALQSTKGPTCQVYLYL